MPTGIVQFFVETKGYGYIRRPDTREEYYVHRRNLLEPIRRGDRVEFVVRENKQGLYADEVKPVDNTARPLSEYGGATDQ